MNTLKKILVTATMVVTLGATTSCGNKNNQPNFVGGLPYTLFILPNLDKHKDYKVKFECEGIPEVYWNSETPTNKKEHTFRFDSDGFSTDAVVLINGNIDNLRFCNESGALLADGNAEISTIIFSNKITKLPEYACYSLEFSRYRNDVKPKGVGVYLPASIKIIGKNAFFPQSTHATFVCEPPSRPSGWDINWCTFGEFARFMSWGLSYYITENYDMYCIVNDDPIHTACYEGTLKYDVTNLVIPETINVNNFECPVVSIVSVGNSKETLESVTIPKSVTVIGNLSKTDGVFGDCSKLADVKFANEYEYLWIGSDTFKNCSSLANITLPKGLINISTGTFDNCTNLTSVVIPNTVRTIDNDAFHNCEKLIDVKFADEYEYLWIGRDTFESCSSLANITLPKGLINISTGTFDNCTNLTSVVIPNTVKTVNTYVFQGAQGGVDKKLTIDLTGYTDSSQIATCNDFVLYFCDAESATFKISSSLNEEDFVEKGWPKTEDKTQDQPKIIWETVSTLNA